MVGNDVDEDMCAAELGMETFLLTDHMLDSGKRDWRSIRNGTYEGLLDYIAALPAANQRNKSAFSLNFSASEERKEKNIDTKRKNENGLRKRIAEIA